MASIDCAKLADTMSCQAMIRLAKAEIRNNAYGYNFAANSPSCVLAAARPDKQKELEILAGNGITRKLCFDPETYKKNGEWESQFEYIRQVPAVFDYNTRPR